MNAKSHRWQKTAIAAAAVALLSLSASQALALSLGRLTVQSALGEPLRAEIDIPDINAEEAASLKANVAKPAAFVAAGLEYNQAMSSLQTTLERRADGRAFIRLSSDKTINDPFVDIILEATWSSGRIVRDYTMLFDPPSLRQSAPAPTLAQVTPAVVPAPEKAPAAAPAPAPSEPSTSISPPVSAAPAPAPKPVASKPAVAAAPFKPAVAPAAESAHQVVVKAGDTASKIVGKSKPAGVSLDQMLVALLRNNPEAFTKDNINRIRTGAVVNLPTADQAQFVSATEATQIVQAQSKDFNEFRRNLATNAPSAAVETASRTASGSVQAKVEDKKPAPTTPDKLTLSKGALQSQANEAKIAKERADKEAKTRADEIAKNIADLKKLEAKTAPAPVAATPAKTTPPPVPAAAPAPVVPVPTIPVAAAPVAPKASEPAAAVVAPPVVAPPAPAVKPMPVPVAAPAVEEPSLIDDLIANPLVPVGAGGLIALIGGIALYRMRQRKKGAAHVDSSFLESRLQPDSFFGASGGQRIDTANESVGGSSMVYSASQLDAADDVDPVAEADVYLAYGRDLQAEEILKEAARTTPGRLAIHVKLLEIFAKRRDTKSFETTANQAFRLAGSNSPDWARISEMGLSIDPTNPLYKPGGSPSDSAESAAPDSTSSFSSTVARAPEPELPPTAKSVDLDLDLDFSLDDEPASAISDVTGASVPQARYDETIKLDRPAAASAPQAKYAQTVKLEQPAADNSMEMDFDLSDAAPLSATPEISLSMDGVSLTEPEPSPQFDTTGTMPIQASAAPAPGADSGMLEFDLGSLSLDLDGPSTQGGQIPTDGPSAENDDPLGTKLALAEEFVSIGDEDGARALIEEVVAEATGDMRAKAQKALASLS